VARSSSPDAADAATSAPSAIVEVFADVVCPFTHVGLRRFVQRRSELGREDVQLRIRAWPLELVNGVPLDVDLVADEVDELHREVAPDCFAGFRPDRFPATSLPAMALADLAYEQGLDVGEQVSLELRSLLFERGVDISRPEVLQALAAENDLDGDLDHRDAVLRDLAEGRRRGVVGSPHFFTPLGGFFCPALDVARDETGRLRVRANRERFDQFLDACLT